MIFETLKKTDLATRQRIRTERTEAFIPELGEETVQALRNFYSIYDEGIYTWLFGLWDFEVGGFYYSNSARDNEGFLPDVESTAQALRLIKGTGLLSALGDDATELPEWMKKRILSFVKGLQDPVDGYFYHPQWGKNIVDSRRGRDYSWAISLLSELGSAPDYPTAVDHLRNKDCSVLPAHFRSVGAFEEYLHSLKEEKPASYSFGNTIASQSREIGAAGEEYTDLLIDFLTERQNKENGLWEVDVNIASVNGFMTISKLYEAFGKPIPNSDRALESTLSVACNGEIPATVCQFYNPWLGMARIVENARKHYGTETHGEFLNKIRGAAPLAVSNTARRMSRFKKDDGSFSYFPDRTSDVSQRASVAVPYTNEGDVNASAVSSVGTLTTMHAALGIENVHVFSKADSEAFFSLLESRRNERRL